MMFLLTCALLIGSTTGSPASTANVPRTCTVRELNDVRFSSRATGFFVATGVVQSACLDPVQSSFILEDIGQRTKLFLTNSIPLPQPGERIAVTCRKLIRDDHDKQLVVRKLETVGRGVVSAPLRLRLEDLDDRRHDLFKVITEATVIDILPDEVDARYCIWLLKDGPVQIPLFFPLPVEREKWIGARIRATATYERLVGGARRFSRPCLVANQADIECLIPPADPFDTPSLDPGDYLTAQEVRAMDRRTFEGDVLATWSGNSVMLRVGNVIAHAQLRHGRNLPSVGTRIKVSGYPDTDLYRIVLSDADWRTATAAPEPDESVSPVPISDITRDKGFERQIASPFHGKLIRLDGTVRSFSPAERVQRRFQLETGGQLVAADFSACPDVERMILPDSKVTATGRCLLVVDADSRKSFPQITGVTLLLRTPADLNVLETPSWWTPERLLGLIVVLVVLLTGIAIWNRFLNHLVARRGRMLYRADIERASEALRVEERTRLAVELHDSLSQNLTGVALQINAGRNELAARMLKSCREELRNCLWDLRNNAIDCDNMDEAIRQTLAPQAEDVALNVRFNVPRKMLSDNTAYAILRIIRELVTNAIRHGQASNIRIAGSLEPERLLFSVRDDGCGFDPENRPDIGEGHFGLQGVCERVAPLGGAVKIESGIGTGTKATVAIPNTTPTFNLKPET